ncbi:unnamed protein product, partial [Notodromas monacha]
MNFMIPPQRKLTLGAMEQVGVLSPTQIRREKIRIWKNVVVLSLGFLLLFMSSSSVNALQSSINPDQGLGTYSLTAIYVGLVVSSLFLVTSIICKLTAKWTIVFCNLCYTTFIAAQFHPRFYTLLPTGLLVGLAAAPLWSAKCSYISLVGKRYSELCALQQPGTLESSERSTVMLFFGVFFATFQSAGIWGNLITSSDVMPECVLELIHYFSYYSLWDDIISSTASFSSYQHCSSSDDDCTDGKDGGGKIDAYPILSYGVTERNSTDVSFCGKNFCDDLIGEVETLRRPVEWKIHLLSGLFATTAFSSGIFIALLLDPLSRFQQVAERKRSCDLQLLFATFTQLRNVNQALILVLVFYGGLEQGFFEVDFTRAYVGCTWGIENIGYVFMVGKAMNAFGSGFSGLIVEYTGRIPVFLAAFLLNVATLAYLLIWEPTMDEHYVLFIMSGAYMLADSVWQTQINGLHGLLFHENVEAAFSAYKVFESLGFIKRIKKSFVNTQAYFNMREHNKHLCVRIKLYALVFILTLGMVCYGVLESRERKREVFRD